jgi:lipoyl-dependent peroxiredoxin
VLGINKSRRKSIMATIKRNASAHWSGTGKEGKGAITTQSGVLSDTPYGFSRRFGDEKGTNPEELIAAAHAGCFTMALAFQLTGAGKPPESLDTSAVVSLEQIEGGFKISAVALTLKAKVPGLSQDEFKKLTDTAKANCPVSKVLNATITLDATLA